jgi:hypothetical protein
VSKSFPWYSVSNAHLACLALALIHKALFHKPQPEREDAVQYKVRDDGGEGKGLAGFPAEFPVVVEEGAGDGDGCIAED